MSEVYCAQWLQFVREWFGDDVLPEIFASWFMESFPDQPVEDARFFSS
jgi:hypothetical protein